jgi:hypothetical protein
MNTELRIASLKEVLNVVSKGTLFEPDVMTYSLLRFITGQEIKEINLDVAFDLSRQVLLEQFEVLGLQSLENAMSDIISDIKSVEENKPGEKYWKLENWLEDLITGRKGVKGVRFNDEFEIEIPD